MIFKIPNSEILIGYAELNVKILPVAVSIAKWRI